MLSNVSVFYAKNVIKHILIFSSVYGGLLLLLNLIPLDLGSGVNAGVLVAAVCITSQKFVRSNDRAPNTSERRKLTWGCLFASYIVSAIILVFSSFILGVDYSEFLPATINDGMLFLIFMSLVLVSLIYYMALGIMFKVFCGICAKKYQENKNGICE